MLQGYGPDEFPAIAAAAGGSGLLVDWVATPAAQRATWGTTLERELGEPLRSPDGRYAYWSLDAVPAAPLAAVTPETLATLLEGREWSP